MLQGKAGRCLLVGKKAGGQDRDVGEEAHLSQAWMQAMDDSVL